LEFINFIIFNNTFEDGVKFVEDLDPGVQVGAGPFPSVDLAQNFRQIIVGGFQ
jgi:hypothetical protein